MPKLIDTTLREGEQAPGVLFKPAVKREIVRGLVAIGIAEIELGLAIGGDQSMESLARWVGGAFPNQSFSMWSRCTAVDIHYVKGLDLETIALSIPVSDLHLEQKLKQNRGWAKATLKSAISLARNLGIAKVAVGFEDATRAEPSFLREMAEIAQGAGAFRIRLADTVGVASPKFICELIDLVADLEVEVGVHCHNDFGMATANGIASLEHGAQWLDVSVFGLGERAGNSRLEEVVGFQALQKGASGYNLLAMRGLSDFLTRATGRRIPRARAIIGRDIFTCETGLHLQGLMADPTTYEPYDPRCVGAERRLLIGAKAGRHAVAHAMKCLGIPCETKAFLVEITRRIRRLAAKKKRSLTDYEIRELAGGIELASMEHVPSYS